MKKEDKESLKEKNKDEKNTKAIVKREKNKNPGKIKRFFKKLGENLKKKWLIDGTKTLILVAIIILIYIGINILLEKVVLPEIDCTQEKIYSLSDESRDKLGNIDKEVTITLINYGNNTSLLNFMEKYKALNDNIKLERIDDISSRTDLMTEYSLQATDSLILVSCGDREKEVTENDMYTIDYTTYQSVDKTEEAITNAILDVIIDEKPKIYFMSNHLAYDVNYFSTIMQKIMDEANEVDTLDIFANGGIPEDCDCLVISTLGEDITEQERDSLISYIRSGGKLLLMCGPNITGEPLTNFQTVLDEYGINISNGILFEGNTSNMKSGYPDIIIEPTQSTSLTQKLNMSVNLCLVDAGKITFNEEKLEELGVGYEVLAQTSDSAFLRTDITQTSATKTSKDEEAGNSTVAAIATKEIKDTATSKLVIFSNEMFAMDVPIPDNAGYVTYAIKLYNNADMILNAVSYLNEREDSITIRKNGDQVSYIVTEQQNNIIMAIIFIIPVLIIIAGIIVWQVRRRKK